MEKWTEQQLQQYISQIQLPDEEMAQQAREHSDQLTKPPGSLGKLEVIAAQLAAITGKLWPDLSKRTIIIMAGDHGVCDEGVSAFPQSVTPQMVHNFLQGGAAVNVLARGAHANVVCVDIGVASELEHPQLRSHKIRYGTANIAQGAAMSREEAIEAIQVGIEVVKEQYGQGVRMFATGEMGIGNTTASAAIVAVLAKLDATAAAGRGTGINDAMLLHKIQIIEQAIAVNTPSEQDPLDVLAKIGGLEIAGLVGVMIGAARHRCPVIIDGYISTAAALVAAKLSANAARYMIASHQSQEQGHVHALASIGLQPMIQLDLRVGEGTGAVLCFHFIDAALSLMKEMATFTSAGIDGRDD
ncbi:MAG TPA: nicotinate-nucleotide--dimethylbenzimidazole phosphoribosyltransferase [Candidatus Paenibacillus intestinavium]|nr:nicotinate-nucleotide--dimethylbenzimidazole phosphoribosyltransferase [Candidatus Paenibacillus intestinavium]